MHSIEAEIEVERMTDGGPDYAYPHIEIVYSYSPGDPGIQWGDNACPPEAAELEVMDVTLIEDAGLDPDAKQLMMWAEEWLQGDGYGAACRNAEEDYPD